MAQHQLMVPSNFVQGTCSRGSPYSNHARGGTNTSFQHCKASTLTNRLTCLYQSVNMSLTNHNMSLTNQLTFL